MDDLTALKDRVLSRIKIDPSTECWNWTASTDTHGYGHFRFGGKMKLAHRASYEAHRGPIPAGMQVCHRCDNRICLNPAHLFIGTWRDNMLDKLAKGRQSRSKMPGERHPLSRLVEEDIRAIRASVSGGAKHEDVAARYGVARAHITQIVNGKRWGHIR